MTDHVHKSLEKLIAAFFGEYDPQTYFAALGRGLALATLIGDEDYEARLTVILDQVGTVALLEKAADR